MKRSVISEYLLEGLGGGAEACADGDKFSKDVGDRTDCFNRRIEEIFGIKVPCSFYEQVAFGQGNEIDKLDTVYSSALQSLLIFSQVSKDNPIRIADAGGCFKDYVNVRFEYRNRVIGYPSSVDVVLSTEGDRDLLFIESKLYEIIRDSKDDGYVIGPSYFSDDKNGYHGKLRLTRHELSLMGIDVPLSDDEYGHLSGSEIKNILAGRRDSGEVNAEGYVKVGKQPGNEYVYPYGIKQMLAHIIGIMNLNYPTETCSDYFKNHRIGEENTDFCVMYNELPGYEESDAAARIKDFIFHAGMVNKVVGYKYVGISLLNPLSYQDLYEANKDGYFRNGGLDVVVNFYHLDRKACGCHD